MAGIRIITDSASDLPVEIAERLSIAVVPLSIRFGAEEFTDRVDLTPTDFWARCKASATLPETAAPSPGAFAEAVAAAQAAGAEGAVIITLSSDLSATYQSALAAAEASAPFPVRVIDSKAVTMAQGLLAISAAEFAQGGAGIDEVVAHTEAARERTGVIGTIDTLEHLKKGGRIGGAQAVLGSVLSIKPILWLQDGKVAENGRQRTRSKSLDHVAKVAREHAPFERLAIVHGDAADVEQLVAKLEGIETDTPAIVDQIGPVVGTHGGPGIVGVCWIRRA